MSNNQSLSDRVSESRKNQKRLEEILMREIERESTHPTSEIKNITEVARELIELWKIMDLF